VRKGEPRVRRLLLSSMMSMVLLLRSWRVFLFVSVSGVVFAVQWMAATAIKQTLAESPHFLGSSLHNSARTCVPSARNVYPGGMF
jgi:hypothetical protein